MLHLDLEGLDYYIALLCIAWGVNQRRMPAKEKYTLIYTFPSVKAEMIGNLVKVCQAEQMYQ